MYISWFSCGITSAVATYLALKTYKDVEIFYISTGSEHSDNIRFLKDCEKFYGQTIHVYSSDKYENVMDVFRKKRFISSPHGAPCTLELKKKVRYYIEDMVKTWEGQIFGFDIRERKRMLRFQEQNPKAKAVFPLIDKQLSKENCMALIERWGIDLPIMYKLGYRNNNCIGCVKGGIGYWNKIRQDFPETFLSYIILERELGSTVLNGLSLTDLPSDAGRYPPIVASCNLFCDLDFMDL